MEAHLALGDRAAALRSYHGYAEALERGRAVAPGEAGAMHGCMHIHSINGAAQRLGANGIAFGHRDTSSAPVIAGVWSDRADNEANIKWVKDYYAAIRPHSGSDGGCINFMFSGDDHRAPANCGAN